MKFQLLTLLVTLLLAACSPGSPVEEAGPSPTAVATVAASLTPSATPAAGDAAVVYGRNDDGTFFHGAADAPVTLTDYSDFL